MAASAAATVKVSIAKICPDRSPEKLENAIKFIFTARRIISIDINIIITFFLFKKNTKDTNRKQNSSKKKKMLKRNAKH